MTSINITKLLPNQPYNVWIRVSTNETLYNQSLPLKIITLPDPEDIRILSTTSKSLSVEWEPYVNKKMVKYMMMCRPAAYDDSVAQIILDSKHQINSSNVFLDGKILTVMDLHPKTQYVFWLSFWFQNRTEPYIWPREERFAFETLADRPSAPGKPSLNHLRGDVYQVTWLPADGNGASIDKYSLEGLRYRSSNRAVRSTDDNHKSNETFQSSPPPIIPLTVDEQEPNADDWTEYYSGNDTYWIIKDLDEPITMYSFRVRAHNTHGWSEFSNSSEPTTYTLTAHREYLVIAVAAPAFVAMLIVIFSCIICGKVFDIFVDFFHLKNTFKF